MDPKQCLVTCTVSRGLFDNEYEASFTTVDSSGQAIPSSSVVSGDALVLSRKPNTGESADAQMRVWCLGPMGESFLVVLPQPTNDGRVRVKVPSGIVVENE